MAAKKVAIIGAGPAGLVATKYALKNGLVPTVFDVRTCLGGLWSRKDISSIWEGLNSNISYFTEQFSDFPWPADSFVFPSAYNINGYLKNYATKFLLEKHIRFEHFVKSVNEEIDVDGELKWRVKSTNFTEKTTHSDIYDCVMVASGLHSMPRIPNIENADKFYGLQIHSSFFRLNDPRLKNKNVAVVQFLFYIQGHLYE